LLLNNSICLNATNNLLHPLPVGKKSTPRTPEIHSVRENISSTTWVISSAIPAMPKSSFRTPCIAYAPCATTLSHICDKLRNFCPPDEYFSQLVPPMLSFHTSRFQSSLWQSSYSIVHARLSLRRGARWQRKVEARAAEGAEIGHKQRRGMLRLQKYTAGGRKFGVLAVLGESANPIPLESYRVDFSHGISRSRFPSCF
jgi:hypothetical protein